MPQILDATDIELRNVKSWRRKLGLGDATTSVFELIQSIVEGDGDDTTTIERASERLAAFATLEEAGYLVQTSTDPPTFAGRQIVGTPNQINVTYGTGIPGNTLLALPQDIHSGAQPMFQTIRPTLLTPEFVTYVSSTGQLASTTVTAAELEGAVEMDVLTTQGDLLTHDGTTYVRLPIGAANTVLRTDGADAEWDKVVLTTDVTGILPVANGGTNASSWTAGSVIFAGAGGTSLAEDNANLFWDDALNRLGVGTNAPGAAVNIVATSRWDDSTVTALMVSSGVAGETAKNLRLGFDSVGANDFGYIQAGETAVGTKSLVLQAQGGNLGVGLITPLSKIHATTNDAIATVTDVLRLNHSLSTGGTAANFGTGILLTGETSTTDAQDMARIQTIWTDSTHATRTSSLQFQTVNSAAALATWMTITGAGNVGIGITATTSALHVQRTAGNSTVTIEAITSGNASLNITAASAGQASRISLLANGTETIPTDTNVKASISMRNAGSTNGNFTSIFGRDSANDTLSGISFINVSHANNEGALTFMTSPSGGVLTRRMTIDGAGNIGIGTTAPAVLLDLGLAGTTLGVMRLAGSTSGNVTIQPQATAGTWTLQLPANDGAANEFLQTDGAGITSWSLVDLTTDVTGTLPVGNGGTNKTSWTAGSVIFAGAGGTALAEDNGNFFWDDSANALRLGDNTDTSNNTLKVYSIAARTTDTSVVLIDDNSTSATNNIGVSALTVNRAGSWSGTGSGIAAGITVTNSSPSAQFGYGVFANVTAGDETIGIYGFSGGTGNISIGVRGSATAAASINYGGFFNATGATTNYGVFVNSGTTRIAPGTTTVAPLLFTSGTNLTTPAAGVMEYNNRFFLTDTDATRRHIVQAAASTKTTAGAPYANDGYIEVVIDGTTRRLMTTA